MERLKRCLHKSHCNWTAVKENGSEKETRGLTLACTLSECLQAVGLQHLYASFTSLGVCRAAHLSALTMQDYPLLGIHTMEDRTRLFHLVQMVKTDLNSLMCEDEDDDDDEGCAVVSRGYSYGSDPDKEVCVEHDEDEDDSTADGANITTAGFARSPHVHRRLDFSCESTDLHQRLLTSPKGPVHKYSSQNREKMSHLSHTGPSLMCDSLHKQTHRPATATTKRFNNKPAAAKHGSVIPKPSPVYESARTAGDIHGPAQSPSSVVKRRAGEQRITVCVRKRPLMHVERRRGEAEVVTAPGGGCVIVHESKEAVDLTHYILQHRFYFDQVFGEESSNEDVYESTAYPLVRHLLSGGKATCFAYGQTGAGKTHTMLGSSPTSPGLYALAVRDIFAHLSASHTRSPRLVYVSFFEIYCGQLYDLLDHRKRLFAREDGQKVVHIAGLREVRVESVSSLLEVISQGLGERTQGTSGANPLSSRSHALLQIQLKCENQQTAGRMWFVDLAGSERASDAKEPDRQSRMEGAEINQSLLALKECIRSLDQEQSHTPFRQSKLTQVLKDSFVGNSMTCMIANISPGHLATEHTLNTLRYADRVKELRRQGEVREGRRGKTVPSPKHNSSNSSSSTRGKSPPKKAKLWQKESPAPPSRTSSLLISEAALCSTPKASRWGEETSPRGREGTGLERVTPVRGWVGTADKQRVKPAGKREVREIEREQTKRHTERVLGQPCHKAHLSSAQREFEGISRRETLKMGRDEQVDRSSTSTCRAAEMQNERALKNTDKKDKEKQKHLRWYHQQLQQFIPSTAPSSSPSLSSSNQAPLSLGPLLQQPSRLSPSAPVSHGLEEALDEHSNHPETSLNRTNNNEGPQGGFDSADTDWRQLWAQTKANYRRMGERQRSRSVKATSEATAKPENRRTSGVGGGERRWAWVATTGTRHADRRTGAAVNTAEAQASYSWDSEDRRDADIEDAFALESPHQRAPAERPFSPGLDAGRASNVGRRDRERGLAAHSRRPLSKLYEDAAEVPLQTVLAQDETCAGPLSCTMDPLSISVLQGEQRVATASFLPGDQNSASVSLHKSDRGEYNARKVEVGHLIGSDIDILRNVENEGPHKELPQSQIQWPLTSNMMKTIYYNERRQDMSCGIGTPEALLVSHQDPGDAQQKPPNQVTEVPAPPLSRFTYASMPAPVKPIEPSVQCVCHVDSSKSHNLTHDSKPPSFLSTQASQSVLGQLNNALKMNGPTGSNGQVPPMMHVTTLENMNHSQWCVVRAHWEQLEEMEALCQTEGVLLCQQPDMEFREYICKLVKIMERKAQCVHSMRAQLQSYLTPNHSSQ
ncbi:kinesin-like protein KIF24 [Betta splendens]|uniref:Kinesin-like protein KIF24 n=1 Tax=Betta splendens TaxID=158456 RepID=A0A9W2Y130_BETSP|nr:kinesin-like protein KIF24 [Betta splendens]